MSVPVIVIHPHDNVAIALRDLRKGEELALPDGRVLTVLSDVPYSHKVALADVPRGKEIFKYGEIIGEAKDLIRAGDWIHTHNLDIEEKKG